jgi:ribulose-phosphate 3-epimerase
MTSHPLRLAPSLLSADFARLAEEIARAEAAGADWLHVDVMDGHFVPNLTIGPPVLRAIRAVAKVPLDVHLMIEEPARWAERYVKAGAWALTFHVEACADEAEARATAAAFRAAGAALVGLSLNPGTPSEQVEPLLDAVDLVLVMSVQPGFGGQSFRPEALPKVRRLRELGFAGHVEMDGGIGRDTLPACVAAGADVLVSGSALFGAADLAAEMAHFRSLGERARREESHAR